MRSTSRLFGITVRTAPFAFALLLAPGAIRADEGGTIYQWTDANGVTRYTPSLDRVPSGARETVLTIQSGAEEPSNEPIYFEPDPRASEVAVPEPALEAAGSPVLVTPLEPDPEPEPGDREAKVRALEAEIAQIEDQLKEYISEPGAAPGPDIPPELRDIAARLPELQGELARLQRRPAPAETP